MTARLPVRTLITYATPGFGASLLIPPFPALLAAFYALHTDATAAGIATVLLVSRLFDGITDPAMGYLTDRTRGRLGARKPWIVGGALMCMLALYVMFIPPDGAGDLYLMGGFLLFYLSYTMIAIPLRSWGSDLSPDYHERSRISSYLAIAFLIGGIVYMFLPVVLASPMVGVVASSELNRETMAVIGTVGMVVLPLTVLLGVWLTPQGRRIEGETAPLLTIWREAFRNKPFLVFIGAFAFSGLAFGSFYAVVIVAISNYFGFAAQVPIFLVILTLAQMLSIPLWVRLANRLGKHRTWGWAWIAHAVLLPCIWLFDPANTSFTVFVIYGCLIAALQGPNMVFPMALVSDIVDYDTLKSRQIRAGSYFSLMSLLNKGANAVGSAIGFYLVAFFNYDPRSAENTELANFGLLFASNGLPALFCLISAFFLFRYPLTEQRHGIVRRRLAARASRAGLASGLSRDP